MQLSWAPVYAIYISCMKVIRYITDKIIMISHPVRKEFPLVCKVIKNEGKNSHFLISAM